MVTVIAKSRDSPSLDKYKKKGYKVVRTEVTRKDGSKGVNVLVRGRGKTISGGSKGAVYRTTEVGGDVYTAESKTPSEVKEAAKIPEPPTPEEVKQEEQLKTEEQIRQQLIERDRERQGLQGTPLASRTDYVPLRLPEEAQSQGVDTMQHPKGGIVVARSESGEAAFVTTGTGNIKREPLKAPKKNSLEIYRELKKDNPLYAPGVVREEKGFVKSTAEKVALGASLLSGDFKKTKAGSWVDKNISPKTSQFYERKILEPERELQKKYVTPFITKAEEVYRSTGMVSYPDLERQSLKNLRYGSTEYGAVKAYSDFMGGVRDKLKYETLKLTRNVGTGIVIGAGAGALASTGTVGRTAVQTVGIAGTSAYTVGIATKTALSVNPARSLGGSVTEFASFAIGARLGSKGIQNIIKQKPVVPKTAGKKASWKSVKQAIKEGAFTRQEVSQLYGKKGLKVYDKSVQSFQQKTDASFQKRAYADPISAQRRVPFKLVEGQRGYQTTLVSRQTKLSTTRFDLLRQAIKTGRVQVVQSQKYVAQTVRQPRSIQEAIRTSYGYKPTVSNKIALRTESGKILTSDRGIYYQTRLKPVYVSKKVVQPEFTRTKYHLFNKKAQLSVSQTDTLSGSRAKIYTRQTDLVTDRVSSFDSVVGKKGLNYLGSTLSYKGASSVAKYEGLIALGSVQLSEQSPKSKYLTAAKASTGIVYADLKSELIPEQEGIGGLKVSTVTETTTATKSKSKLAIGQVGVLEPPVQQQEPVLQQPILEQVPVVKTRQRSRSISRNVQRYVFNFAPTPTTPTPKLPGARQSGLRTRTGQAFDVFSRVRGKDVKINLAPLSEKSAYGVGVQFTDESSAASFYVKETKGVAREKKFDFDPLYVVGQKYRKPVRNPGSKRFIEKNKFRIDTPGEFREITQRGLSAIRTRGAFK